MQFRPARGGTFERIEARDIMRDWVIPAWYYVLTACAWSLAVALGQGVALF